MYSCSVNTFLFYCNVRLCAPRSDKKCPLGFYLNHALATEPSSRLNDDVDSSSSSVFNGSYPVDVSATMQGGSDTPRSFTSRGSEQVLVWHCEACPSGRFGNVPWLNNDTCSGPCREGKLDVGDKERVACVCMHVRLQ